MVLIDWLVFALYRWIGIPVAIALLRILRSALPFKMQEMLSDRSQLNLQALPARPIWIHASSGEVEYAKSVIRSLKENYPQVPVLVTYFSPSAKKLIHKFPGIDLAMALPWDRKKDVEKFLNFYNPRAFLVARTDVWPEVSLQVQKRKIPSALFAATFASQSSRKGLLSGPLSRIALNALSVIFCVSDEDKENLQDLGVKTAIHVTGDTRFDQVLFRLSNPNPVLTQYRPSPGEKIFVCGSTWPQDEDVLLDSFQHWISKGGRIILAPHEVSTGRIFDLERKISDRKWTSQRYADNAAAWTSQILLVNQVGSLQELYSWGSLAFVGGSFKDKVHSVMEPLCAGMPVLVGPKHQNNREALSFQHLILGTGFFAVSVVQNALDIQRLMDNALAAPSPHPLILQKVRESSGATGRLLLWLEKNLNP